MDTPSVDHFEDALWELFWGALGIIGVGVYIAALYWFDL